MNCRFLIVTILLFACGCGSKGAPKQAILILLDAARADRFSCYGYERKTTSHMDALAEKGRLYLNHYAQGTKTHSSMPTLFYSRYYALPLFPPDSEVPFVDPENLFLRKDDQCISLPRALSLSGMKTAAISAHLWLKEGTPFAGGFDELYDLTLKEEADSAYPNAEKVVDAAMQWIEANRGRDYFLYLHLMDTHFPHFFGQEAQRFLDAASAPLDRFNSYGHPLEMTYPLPEKDRAYLDAIYDGSLLYTDFHLNRLFSSLESSGALHDTLIVITSDHGEHLMEHSNRFQHSGPWYEPVARIPLIVSYPRKLDPARIESFSENVDIFPTMLHLLQCPLPAGKATDGINLVSLDAERAHAFMKNGVRGERFKLLSPKMDQLLLRATPIESGLQEGALFDLLSDPGELNNLWAKQPGEVEALLDVFRNRMRSPYDRFKGARIQEPPSSFFAVKARHFRFNQSVVDATRNDALFSMEDEELKSRWILSRHFSRYKLLGTEGAPPFYLHFPVPSGEYTLTAFLAGHGEVSLHEDKKPLKVRGPSLGTGREMEWKKVSLGRIKIRDNTFRALLKPLEGEGGFGIRYMGFLPAGAAEPETREPDPEMIRKLEALGYGG